MRTRGKVLRGTIQKKQHTFAFVLPEKPGLPDLYVNREQAVSLLNGDRVEYRVVKHGRLPSAVIHKIISRRQKQVVGKIIAVGQKWLLQTQEGEHFQLKGKAHPNEWVVGRIDNYPSTSRLGVVYVTEPLGTQLIPLHDTTLAITRFGLRENFPDEVIAQAKECRQRKLSLTRRDLRQLPFVTIDGEDARDFDDAVCAQRTGHSFILFVAIADVSHFVSEDSALDKEARLRGCSVYFPGRCLPMLPEILSNDLCSLIPNTDRLALTAELLIDANGNFIETNFYEATIRTASRLTYHELHRFYSTPSACTALHAIAEPLKHMLALYKVLERNRNKRGVLDFELPECEIKVNSSGEPQQLQTAPRYESHKLIEEFMIAANRAVAQRLRSQSRPTLYRVHEPPDALTLGQLNTLLRSVGLNQSLTENNPKAFAHVLAATRTHPSARVLHQAILRAQKQARYDTTPLGHFGLALKDYLHFTSPIRRYPDLIVHRLLKRLIKNEKKTDNDGDEVRSVESLAFQMSDTERTAMEAERFVVRRKQCWWLRDRLGEVFQGKVSGLTSRGLFVELPPLCVDGFLPLALLSGSYELDELGMRLTKPRGRSSISIGDALTVTVSRVSVQDGEIELAPTRI
ncbi:MAG: VacB/RNase II family 3'-5' exoribonuclease [Deltaproteobacteria bacterium]|nr:VacB/RNase II family 3'-5' exoribonuclease [Deltaproteobacteria bacterium]